MSGTINEIIQHESPFGGKPSFYTEEEGLSLHTYLCGAVFAQWKDTCWFVCERGHTYWQVGERFWCREAMEGNRIG